MAQADCEDSILVRVHRGTGAGIISNGRIFIGRNGNVGEIGHIQVDPLGERCHCGNFGCLETVAANAAIEQRVRHLLEQGYQSRLTPDDCTIKTICKAANKGDATACEVIEYVGRHLGKTIAIAINLFNPQKIVVAGEIVEAEKVLLPAIEGCINARRLRRFVRTCRWCAPPSITALQSAPSRWSNAPCSMARCCSVCLRANRPFSDSASP